MPSSAGRIGWPLRKTIAPRFRSSPAKRRFWPVFDTAPAAIAYIVLAVPIAQAIAFGALRSADGIELVAVSLAAIGLGVLAETWFVLGTYAFYAVEDVRDAAKRSGRPYADEWADQWPATPRP